ncbi:hypothetical protein D1007_55491 [Hordeum vulgare]|nr:hypothetical protein D1007_55491 [Hordeum vulgare]
MKAGVKNCTESGENGPINNTKVNEHLNTYYTALKAVDPLHWEDRDLDPEIIYCFDCIVDLVDIVHINLPLIALYEFYGKLGWEVPEDLLAYQDELMERDDLMDETPQDQEDVGTPLTDSAHVESHVDAGTQMDDHGSASTHDNHVGMPQL